MATAQPAARVSTTLLSSSVKVVSANVTAPPDNQTGTSRKISLITPGGVTVEPVITTPGSKSMGYATETVGVRRQSTKGATISSTTPARPSLSQSGAPNISSPTSPNVSTIDFNEMSEIEKKKLEERRRSSLARKGSQIGVIICDVTVGDDKVTTKQSEIILEEEPTAEEEKKKTTKCCVIL